VEEET